MFRGYWLSLIAVVGWLALAGWAEGHGGGKGNYYKQHAAARKSASPTKQLAPLQNPSDAIAVKTPCDPSIPDNERDLCQQWRMAEAADRMVGVSIGQLVLTLLSLIGLGVTIYYTRKTTSAAIQANSNTLKAMKSELRPWIELTAIRLKTPTSMEITKDHIKVDLEMSYENVGHSPAKNVEIRAVIYKETDVDLGFKIPIHILEENRTRKPVLDNTIFPTRGETRGIIISRGLADIKGHCTFYVFATICYTFDDFPEVHQTAVLKAIYLKQSMSLEGQYHSIDMTPNLTQGMPIVLVNHAIGIYAD